MLALQQGQPLELADLSRKTRISIPALRLMARSRDYLNSEPEGEFIFLWLFREKTVT